MSFNDATITVTTTHLYQHQKNTHTNTHPITSATSIDGFRNKKKNMDGRHS